MATIRNEAWLASIALPERLSVEELPFAVTDATAGSLSEYEVSRRRARTG
jgi:hypothetical protein